jgi:hypothetical protein
MYNYQHSQSWNMCCTITITWVHYTTNNKLIEENVLYYHHHKDLNRLFINISIASRTGCF